ncbi:hypothetical protein [Streptomyces sp. NPDC002209]|uniref:hypothetical protein n=1 Tax=Streptomyces sp. NPDC002209 TaxID=3364638 RepID=UPI00368A14D8
MNRASPDRSTRPFTLVVCANCQSPASGQVIDRLRQVVRDCPHGVMVSTGCLGSLLRCRRTAGLHAVVQPCTPDRKPHGVVVRLGPMADEADAETVAVWLRAGMPDDDTLPSRPCPAPAPQRVGHLN